MKRKLIPDPLYIIHNLVYNDEGQLLFCHEALNDHLYRFYQRVRVILWCVWWLHIKGI